MRVRGRMSKTEPFPGDSVKPSDWQGSVQRIERTSRADQWRLRAFYGFFQRSFHPEDDASRLQMCPSPFKSGFDCTVEHRWLGLQMNTQSWCGVLVLGMKVLVSWSIAFYGQLWVALWGTIVLCLVSFPCAFLVFHLSHSLVSIRRPDLGKTSCLQPFDYHLCRFRYSL